MKGKKTLTNSPELTVDKLLKYSLIRVIVRKYHLENNILWNYRYYKTSATKAFTLK